MTSSKKSHDLDYYLDIFERSYAVRHSCKVSYLGLNWFRIYGGGGAFGGPFILCQKSPGWLGLRTFCLPEATCTVLTGPG